MDARQPLDAPWFDRLHTILQDTGELFAALELPPAALLDRRIAFEADGCRSNPNLHAEHVDTEALQQRRGMLDRLATDIAAQEDNPYVRDAYRMRIEEAIASHDLLIAAACGDKPAFCKADQEVYGRPNAMLFAAGCAWVRRDAARMLDVEGGSFAALAESVLLLVPDLHGDASILIPPKDTFQRVRDLHNAPRGYYDTLFGPQGLPAGPFIEQREGDEICRRMLENIGSDCTLADATNGVWAVLHDARQVVRPAGYRLERNAFIGVVCHEIGSHLLEAVNGSHQSLRLLGLGLDRVEQGNEGRAFLREQIVYAGAEEYTHHWAWEYTVALHMAVGLAEGLYDHPYTFAELYQVVRALHSLWYQRRHPQSDAKHPIDNQSWHLAARVMKGTDGTGGAFIKDIHYLEGNVKCWAVAEQQPEVILLGDRGKYDITNKRHIGYLQGLHILSK